MSTKKSMGDLSIGTWNEFYISLSKTQIKPWMIQKVVASQGNTLALDLVRDLAGLLFKQYFHNRIEELTFKVPDNFNQTRWLEHFHLVYPSENPRTGMGTDLGWFSEYRSTAKPINPGDIFLVEILEIKEEISVQEAFDLLLILGYMPLAEYGLSLAYQYTLLGEKIFPGEMLLSLDFKENLPKAEIEPNCTVIPGIKKWSKTKLKFGFGDTAIAYNSTVINRTTKSKTLLAGFKRIG